jgi:opacity protein-like surface antigen
MKARHHMQGTAFANCLTGIFFGTLLFSISLQAQDRNLEPQNVEYDEGRLNSNVAIAAGTPLSLMAKYATVGVGINYGVGYNFDRHNSLIGEFMWNDLQPTGGALNQIRAATNNPNLNGHGNFVGLMANYRLRFEGKTFGAYLIAGGGGFYRNVSLSQLVTLGNSVTCSPEWLWWGFSCSSGVVTSNQTVASASSTAPGADGGVGFTVKLPDSRYKFYIEARYYYSPNKSVSTQLLPISAGIRF